MTDATRVTTFLERLLIGIVCIGFCSGDDPQNREHCMPKLLQALGQAETHWCLPVVKEPSDP
jgi:hypothetical protein